MSAPVNDAVFHRSFDYASRGHKGVFHLCSGLIKGRGCVIYLCTDYTFLISEKLLSYIGIKELHIYLHEIRNVAYYAHITLEFIGAYIKSFDVETYNIKKIHVASCAIPLDKTHKEFPAHYHCIKETVFVIFLLPCDFRNLTGVFIDGKIVGSLMVVRLYIKQGHIVSALLMSLYKWLHFKVHDLACIHKYHKVFLCPFKVSLISHHVLKQKSCP